MKYFRLESINIVSWKHFVIKTMYSNIRVKFFIRISIIKFVFINCDKQKIENLYII